MTGRGYDFLENEEGERLFAYDDRTGRRVMPGDLVKGTLTIGVGHTGPDVYPGQTITNEESRALFDKDTDRFEKCVEDATSKGPRPNDNEFDAMVSLAFNIGEAGFKGSTVARMWNAGNKSAAGKAFAMWNKAHGFDSDILSGRRAREQAVFFAPMPSEVPQPMPQTVDAPKTAMQSKTVIAGGVSVAAGAATVADQINQVTPIVESIATVGASFQNVLKLGALALSIVALAAVGYMLWRYIQKRRAGDVVVK